MTLRSCLTVRAAVNVAVGTERHVDLFRVKGPRQSCRISFLRHVLGMQLDAPLRPP